jgi:hypothetical protein
MLSFAFGKHARIGCRARPERYGGVSWLESWYNPRGGTVRSLSVRPFNCKKNARQEKETPPPEHGLPQQGKTSPHLHAKAPHNPVTGSRLRLPGAARNSRQRSITMDDGDGAPTRQNSADSRVKQ